MLSPQPIQLVKYLCFRRNIIPKHLKRLFYLSYEDALWDILEKKNVRKGSKILVPDFFCRDVEDNIKSHGYKIIHYHIKKDLSADIKDFEDQVKKHKPAVVIAFHPVGITSNLFKNRGWIKLLDKRTLLIEDSVHRVLNPLKIEIYKRNHFVINSLRKVVPFQGASVYGQKDDLNFDTPPLTQSLLYSIKVHFLWLLMDICWNTGQFLSAEKLMIKGYNLIGDSVLPAKGFLPFKILEDFLDHNKIAKINFEQACFYESKLKNITKNPIIYQESDLKRMMAWPIVLDKETADETLKNIRSKGLLVRFELNDSAWSKNQKIIYLPMGPHITHSDQMKACQIVTEALT
jgi:hypothetical protein